MIIIGLGIGLWIGYKIGCGVGRAKVAVKCFE
jgi:hypothetical protein